MAKATALSADMMSTPQPAPKGAAAPRAAVSIPKAVAPAKPEMVPFQIRIPKADRFAIKVDAAQLHFSTESEFMLACYHFYMQHHELKK